MKSKHLHQIILLTTFFLLTAPIQIVRADQLQQDTISVYLPLIQLARPVQINESVAIGTRTGSYLVFGDVRSNSLPLEDVTISVKLYSMNHDEYIGTITNTVMLSETLPGQLNPFNIPTLFSNNDVGRYTADIIHWRYIDQATCFPLTVVSVRTEPTILMDDKVIFVDIRNDSGSVLTGIHGAIWSMDQSHHTELIRVDDMDPGEIRTVSEGLENIYSLSQIMVSFQGRKP